MLFSLDIYPTSGRVFNWMQGRRDNVGVEVFMLHIANSSQQPAASSVCCAGSWFPKAPALPCLIGGSHDDHSDTPLREGKCKLQGPTPGREFFKILFILIF